MKLKHSIVRSLQTMCTWVDSVAYRPAVVKLTRRAPRSWRCELTKLAMWLDLRWETGEWAPGDWPLDPTAVCEACGRRPAWLVVGFHPTYDEEEPDPEWFLGRHPVRLCGWCRLEATDSIEDAASLELALARARERSVAWRWT